MSVPATPRATEAASRSRDAAERVTIGFFLASCASGVHHDEVPLELTRTSMYSVHANEPARDRSVVYTRAAAFMREVTVQAGLRAWSYSIVCDGLTYYCLFALSGARDCPACWRELHDRQACLLYGATILARVFVRPCGPADDTLQKVSCTAPPAPSVSSYALAEPRATATAESARAAAARGERVTDANIHAIVRRALARGEDVTKLDTSRVTNMAHLFSMATGFDQDLSGWDMQHVTTIAGMFMHASAFDNGGRALAWNTRSLIDASDAFHGAVAFNQDVSPWDTSNLVRMDNFLRGARAFNRSLAWNTSSLQSMASAFQDATCFEGDGLCGWDVSNLQDMSCAFRGACSFCADLSRWHIGKLRDASGAFMNAGKWPGAGIHVWSPERLEDAKAMFAHAHAMVDSPEGWKLPTTCERGQMCFDAPVAAPRCSKATSDALFSLVPAARILRRLGWTRGDAELATVHVLHCRLDRVGAWCCGDDGAIIPQRLNAVVHYATTTLEAGVLSECIMVDDFVLFSPTEAPAAWRGLLHSMLWEMVVASTLTPNANGAGVP